jgi:hypothetical protein
MLGLVAPYDHVKNDASCSLRPETATRNMARAIPASVMVCPFLLPGRVVCLSSWNRGTVGTVACRESARGKRWSQGSRPE